MFRCTRRIASLVLAAVGTLAGCREANLPERVWESEHFRYHSRADDPAAPCPAITARLDRNFEVLRGSLSFPWDPGAKVDYYKFRDSADRDQNGGCPDQFNCAWARHVETVNLFDEHELVHAYLNGPQVPPLLFAEGLAVALACNTERTSFARVTLEELLAWRPDKADPLAPGDYYDTAAWFVGHLWRTYGSDRFLRLYRALPRHASQAQIAQTFRDILGDAIEVAWTAAFSALNPQLGCIPLWACAQPALPIDGTTVEWPATCTAERDARSFELSGPTSLKVAYFGLMAFPGACESGRAPLLFEGSADPSLTLTQLPGGRYYVYRDGSLSERIALSKLDSPFSGPSCAVQSPLELDEIHARVSIALPEGELPVAVRLHSTARRRGVIGIDLRDNRSLVLGVDAALCPGCGEDATACRPVSSNLERATLEGDQVLLVRSAEPSADGFVTIGLDLR
jgi:hypothetical protein